MGRGMVEAFDDFRDLARRPMRRCWMPWRRFCAEQFDRRHVLRTILNSRTYQAQSTRNAFNKDDRKYFSHYQPRMLSAEPAGRHRGSDRFARAHWRVAGRHEMHATARTGIGELIFSRCSASLSGNPPANANAPMTP